MSINGTLVTSQEPKEKGDNKMKRNILIAIVAALTISLVATGAALAQGRGPGGNGISDGTGVNLEVTLSNYMPSAMAEVLGLSVDEVNAQLASGETFYTIALAQGFTAEQLPALMTSIRSEAIDLATSDSILSTDQAAFLLENQYGGNTRGNSAGTANMYSTGDRTGTGIYDDTCIPLSTGLETGGSMRRAGGPR